MVFIMDFNANLLGIVLHNKTIKLVITLLNMFIPFKHACASSQSRAFNQSHVVIHTHTILNIILSLEVKIGNYFPLNLNGEYLLIREKQSYYILSSERK